jgi:hypothetical protein
MSSRSAGSVGPAGGAFPLTGGPDGRGATVSAGRAMSEPLMARRAGRIPHLMPGRRKLGVAQSLVVRLLVLQDASRYFALQSGARVFV